MIPVSTAELASGIAEKVTRDVNASLGDLLLHLFAKEMWVSCKDYARLWGLSEREIYSRDAFLRKSGALDGEHKSKRYNRFVSPNTGKSILDGL